MRFTHRLTPRVLPNAALFSALILSLAACGVGKQPETVTNSSVRESSAAVMYGVVVPEKPDPNPVWTVEVSGYRSVVAGSGMFAVLHGARGSSRDYQLSGMDASTGREIWADKPTSNPLVLASDSPGPGVRRTSTIVYADDVSMPQQGTTPARIRTDIVALNAADGQQLWRYDCLQVNVDNNEPERVLGVTMNNQTVVVLTPAAITGLDTRTGTVRWRNLIDRKLSEEQKKSTVSDWERSDHPARFLNADLGESTVVVTAQISQTVGYVAALDEKKGTLLWQVPTATDGDRTSQADQTNVNPNGKVVIAGNRVIIGQAVLTNVEKTYESSVPRIVGLDLGSGKQMWTIKPDTSSSSSSSSHTPNFVVDAGTGTVIYPQEKHMQAYAISDGSSRWPKQLQVTTEIIDAKDKLIFAALRSGDNTDLSIMNTIKGEQITSFSIGRVSDFQIFAGAVVIATDETLRVYR